MLKNIIKKQLLSSKEFIKIYSGMRFIFVYHHINEHLGGFHSEHYTTRSADFEDQIGMINDCFKVLPLTELVTRGRKHSRENHCAITFDDGYRSVLTHARPILASSGLPYTIFVNGAAVVDGQNWMSNIIISPEDKPYRKTLAEGLGIPGSGTSDLIPDIIRSGKFKPDFPAHYYRADSPRDMYLNSADIAYLYGEGVEIGEHSWDHCVLSHCQDAYLRAQLLRGKELIHQITGSEPVHFALPYGKSDTYTRDTLRILDEFGYRYVYTTNPNRIRPGQQKDLPMVLPRIGIVNDPVSTLRFYINRSLVRQYEL